MAWIGPASERARGAGWLWLLSTVACQQVLGLHDRPEATDAGVVTSTGPLPGSDAGGATGAEVAGTCGQLLHPSTACAACMDQNCCAQAGACASDSACREASDCLVGCTDDTCRTQCAEFDSLPTTLINLRACRTVQCASACGSTCGEFNFPEPSCQTCVDTSCCSQGAQCAANPSCVALNQCISTCFGPASCPNNCEAQYPQGMSDYQAWASCTNGCVSQCQPGQNWTCLDGPIVWPKPPSETMLQFSVTFVSFISELPFVGSSVKACDKLDLACNSPLAQSTTDATGTVTLIVPPGLNGFDGYLDVTGGAVAGTGAPVFPSLWYPVPFIVADGARGRTEIPAQDEFTDLAAVTGTTLDPTRGHFAINAVDCAFTPAAGVSFSIGAADAQTVGYYLVGGVPATSATSTDQSGVGIFLNLPIPAGTPARLVTVNAVLSAGGESIGSLSLAVRAGTVTTGSSFPPEP